MLAGFASGLRSFQGHRSARAAFDIGPRAAARVRLARETHCPRGARKQFRLCHMKSP